jgi:hypothetical protein
MQSYYVLFGGNSDGLNIPTHENGEVITMAVEVTGVETYHRETLSLGEASITIYRDEKMPREEVINRLVEYYTAWCIHRLGGRR